MAKDTVIAGLDIGNNTIRSIIAVQEGDSRQPHIVGVGSAHTQSLRKGVVVDPAELTEAVSRALEEAERMSGIPVHHVFVGVSGHHLSSHSARGVVAIGGKNITPEDVKRAYEAAEAVSLPPNKYRLHTIAQSYCIDDQTEIKNPIGLSGIRLEMEAHILSGQLQVIENMERTIHNAGVDIDAIVPSVLCSSSAVLTRRQKELGACLIDIGSDTTSLAVYENGTVLHTAFLPIGGSSVTNDIAIGLKTSVDTAEKIKREYGTITTSEVRDNEVIDLSLLSKLDNHKVGKKLLSEIIEARYQEILSLVHEELRSIGKAGMLPAGVVLVGSGAKMHGLLDQAREILGLPVQIGFPQDVKGLIDRVDDPGFASVVGITIWGMQHEKEGGWKVVSGVGGMLGGIWSGMRRLLPF